MKQHNYYFLGGLLFWILETAFFGWNEHAMSVQEKVADGVSLCLIAYGALYGLGSSIKTTVNIINNGTKDEVNQEIEI